MKCWCLSVLLVYATRPTANCIALAILIGTYQLVNGIRACSGNACVCTCKTKIKIEPKLKWQRKRKCQCKTKTKMILKTKKTLAWSLMHMFGLVINGGEIIEIIICNDYSNSTCVFLWMYLCCVSVWACM